MPNVRGLMYNGESKLALQLRVRRSYNHYSGVTTMLLMRMMSRHVYCVLLTYLCMSCILVRWLYCNNIYCVDNTLTNTLSDLNGAVWVQGKYFQAIATVITVLCFCCHVFWKWSLKPRQDKKFINKYGITLPNNLSYTFPKQFLSIHMTLIS